MNDLEALIRAVPDLGACTSEVQHIVLRVQLGEEGSVLADVEWTDAGAGAELRVGIVERNVFGARVIQGLVFDVQSGDLIRAGSSVSAAAFVQDESDRADALAEASERLHQAVLLGPTAETKNAA